VTWPQEVCDQAGQPGGRNDSERKERSSHGTTRDRIGEDITTRGDEGQGAPPGVNAIRNVDFGMWNGEWGMGNEEGIRRRGKQLFPRARE
jgi:hypothetical protein